ncbi:MAG: hypothetical protein ACI831_001774, partial [Candidatus Azotimanducaceae bacterium]
MGLPRPEYPRPILTREQWLNLNGHWHYEADPLNVGLNERWYLGRDYSAQILVPYPIESEASEVHNLTPGPVHWYERCF